MKYIYSLQMRRKNDTLDKFKDKIRVWHKLRTIQQATKDLFPSLKYDKDLKPLSKKIELEEIEGIYEY